MVPKFSILFYTCTLNFFHPVNSTLSPSPNCERWAVSESTPPYPPPAKINKTIAANTSARGLIDENVPHAGFTAKIYVDLRCISKRYVSQWWGCA